MDSITDVGLPCDTGSHLLGVRKETDQPHEKETSQPRVIQTGEVSLRKVSMKDGTCCVTARTRLMAIGKRSLWQVEVSPGNWRDCGNDCEQVLRKALDK